MTLAQLHDALQITMGWEDCHLHQYEIAGRQYGVPYPEMDFGEPMIHEKTVHLYDVLGSTGAKAIYTYDFGDGWEHSIVVEKLMEPEPGIAYPVCTGGKLHCPPEDCGGVYGYYGFLEATGNPDHKQHEELLEWIGGRFDPEAFSVNEIMQNSRICNGGCKSLNRNPTLVRESSRRPSSKIVAQGAAGGLLPQYDGSYGSSLRNYAKPDTEEDRKPQAATDAASRYGFLSIYKDCNR